MKRMFILLSFGILVTLGSPILGCDGEDCLVYGENCSAAYKQSEYGTTNIYCCSGNCQRICPSGSCNDGTSYQVCR